MSSAQDHDNMYVHDNMYIIERFEDNGWAVLKRADGELFNVPQEWRCDMPFGKAVDKQPLELADLPERLRQTRKERGLTLAEVSVETGLTVSALSRIENGISKPKTESFVRLLRWLEATPGQADAPSGAAPEDTMTAVRLLLERDPALSPEAVEKLLRAWRPMYKVYAESDL